MKSRINKGGFSLKNFFLFCLIASILGFSACGKTGNSPQSGGLDILSSDETPQAAELVNEANGELKKIKAIYKENEGRIAEIQAAMSSKENDKIKKIADDLVFQINDGITLGESAISKIEKAEELSINDTFREYLELKRESLRKQVDAFEFRRQAAQLLSKGSGSGNPKESESIRGIFKEKEGSFQKLWDEGRAQSQEANLFYKESLKKSKE